MLQVLAWIYLWVTIFIMIRYWYLSRLSIKEAKYRLEMPPSIAQTITYWGCIATIFCFWPILLLIFPTDFVGAFIFNKKNNLNSLLFRMARIVGFTVGVVNQLFK